MAIIEPTSILLHSFGIFHPTYLNSSESTVKSFGLVMTGSWGSSTSSESGFVFSPSGDVVSVASLSGLVVSSSTSGFVVLPSGDVVSPFSASGSSLAVSGVLGSDYISLLPAAKLIPLRPSLSTLAHVEDEVIEKTLKIVNSLFIFPNVFWFFIIHNKELIISWLIYLKSFYLKEAQIIIFITKISQSVRISSSNVQTICILISGLAK